MHIIACTAQHLDCAAALFDAYRGFYEQPSDLPGCRAFLENNLENARSRIFLLFDDSARAVGFAQLYPAIDSISMRGYYYLSDLYIDPACRQQGYARALMHFLTERFRAEGAQRLTLDTATSNVIAQGLYESLGYERERVYITYHQMLDAR
jgi:ribosomal protein S18 acetylase RimI-like enzyme